MKKTIHWLGGWASSLECWKPMFEHSFPEYEHAFYDTHELLGKTSADAGLPQLDEHHIVAGWSMGTLLAHHWMDVGSWPVNLPFLSVCPVFQFIRNEFGTPIILRMEKKIETDRESVLRDFWRRMPKVAEIPSQWEESWIEGAHEYSNEELNEGLEFLRNTVVNPSTLASVPRRWELLAGDQDLLAPIPDKTLLPVNARLEIYSGGHVPFWEHPEQIGAALQRLAH